MESSEIETVLLLNNGDLRRGYFTVTTSDKRIANNIRKRLSGSDFIETINNSFDVVTFEVPAESVGRLVTFWRL